MPISPQELLAGRQSAEEAQLNKIASGCASYGEELALMKIAETEMKAQEDEDETEDKEEEKLDEEEKKEAAAMGLFALDGFIDKLASAGDLVYNDPTVYIRALAEERGAYAKVAAVMDHLRKGWAATREGASKGWAKTKDMADSAVRSTRRAGQLTGDMLARQGVAAPVGVGAGVGALTGAGAGYMGSDDGVQGAILGGLGGAALGAGGGYGARALGRSYNPTIAARVDSQAAAQKLLRANEEAAAKAMKGRK